MFGSSRRKRAASNPSQPLNRATANPAATTAATSAFLKNRASNVSLSSAAAATALKARPMTPTSVADVQTKRTLKRTGSTSSMGSSLNGSQRGERPQMERRLSSGSMTDRTFRDPSPARGVPSASDAPPVPTIPQGVQSAAHRRATSMEAPPARITSPTPSGRGASLQPTGSRRNGQRSSVTDLSELTSAERSRGSVNFSYPTNSRPNSPMSMKRLTSPSSSRQNPRITSPNSQSLVYDPNTRSFLPAVEVHAIQQKLYDAANKPAKTKKRVPPGNNVGSHFSDGTVGGRPKGTAVEEIEARARQVVQPVQEEPVKELQQEDVATAKPLSAILAELPPAPSSETVLIKKRRKKVAMQEPESDQGSYVPNSSDNDSDTATYTSRRSQQLAKKPSIVREDREREEEEDDTPRPEKSKTLAWNASPIERHPSPSPLPRSKAGREHDKDLAVADSPVSEAPQAKIAPPMQHIEPIAEPVAEPVAESNGLTANGSVRGARVSSLSPGRNAHFATTPDNLMVKHQPPPRSISPKKSALKHSNSRTSSPMPGSETSNSPGAPEEQLLPRKKSNRVSFDETNVAVGEAAPSLFTDSPVASSPQAGKRPWYSIGRGKKKDVSITDDEEDEVMKPRPALPFFGSVRERKNRDVEERVLVKPAEPVETKSAFRSPLSTAHTEDAIETPVGQSNDHIVGAIFAQDSTSKNAANISKSREPLPPQVTTVEGSGYHSDSDSTASETGNDTPTATLEPETVKEPLEPIQTQFSSASETIPILQTATATVEESDDVSTPTQTTIINHIPEIAISEPTPTPEESEKRKGWPDIPGAWDTSDSESNDTPRISLDESNIPTPAAAGISEPTPDLPIHASPKIAVEQLYTTPVIMEETESEADVFSDAAEELTSSDEEGFLSLNAVVESPITRSAFMVPNTPASPTSRLVKDNAYQKSGSSEVEKPISHGEGWDTAQEYWSSLSADKKRQIELDAQRTPEDESDTEIEVKPIPKPKKKKKVVRPAATEPVEPVISNERTYMIQPGSKAAPDGFTPLRSSMRLAPPAPVADVSMKKSMRDPGQGSMRGSMRGSQTVEPRGSMQNKSRPLSLPVEPRVPMVQSAANHSRNLSSTSPAVTSTSAYKPQTPALRRKKSSDSESSFKRAKPSSDRGMMRTMRVGNGSAQQQETASSKFSMRSMSPTESVTRRPFSSSSQPSDVAQAPMRMSMRGSNGTAPTMRGPASRAKSPSNSMKMPNFGRAKPVKSQKPTKSLSSRFANSSDEEDERPTFKSRFVDSSDDSDDEPVQKSSTLGRTMRSTPASTPPVPATNLRAIPKRTGVEDGDSSDLPDSDDETPISASAKLAKKRQANGSPILNGNTQGLSDPLRRSGSGRGNITTVSSPPVSRPTQKRRGSIMSILRRKKDDTSKVRKSDVDSPARRDTPLERSKSDLAALRTPVLGSPRLQKRNPLSRENSLVVPFSPLVTPKALTDGENGQIRPFSADGVGIAIGEKPEAVRRFTTDGPVTLNGNGNGNVNGNANGNINGNVNGIVPVAPVAVATGGAGVTEGGAGGKKKKKFASLRRMFRLDD